MTPSSPRIEVIDVPWIGPSLNKIWAGVHWSKRKKIADEAHQAVLVAIRNVVPFTGPVTLAYFPFIGKGKRYDLTNYAVTIKGIEDGLVGYKIIESDSFKVVQRVTIHQPELTKEPSFMRVVIEGV